MTQPPGERFPGVIKAQPLLSVNKIPLSFSFYRRATISSLTLSTIFLYCLKNYPYGSMESRWGVWEVFRTHALCLMTILLLVCPVYSPTLPLTSALLATSNGMHLSTRLVLSAPRFQTCYKIPKNCLFHTTFWNQIICCIHYTGGYPACSMALKLSCRLLHHRILCRSSRTSHSHHPFCCSKTHVLYMPRRQAENTASSWTHTVDLALSTFFFLQL